MRLCLSLIVSAVALLLGIAALITWGVFPPIWLAGVEATLVLGASLAYGFTAYMPDLTLWLWTRPIRGTILICLGVASIYIPAQFLIAAYLIGVGTRLLWQSATELATEPSPESRALARVTNGELQRKEF